MAISLKRITEKQLTLSDLMIGREKVETEEIIKAYPKGITIDEIDVCYLDSEEVFVYTFKEDRRSFAFAGHVLKNLFKSWLEAYEGSIDDVNDTLSKETIVLRLERTKTKDGKREVTKAILV